MSRPHLPYIMPRITFGAWIKKTRERKGVSQNALARRIGVDQPRISKWEAGVGQPTSKLVPRIYNALRCTPEEIIMSLPLLDIESGGMVRND